MDWFTGLDDSRADLLFRRMASDKLILARVDAETLIANLRGEVGEVITTWFLMRHFMSEARKLQTDDPAKDMGNRNLAFLNLLADKLSDELVGRLSELAEKKIGQLTFYYAARKLDHLHQEVDEFARYILKSRIRDKRNRDVSHKQMPGKPADNIYIHISYRVLMRAVVLALRLMKKIDRHFLGPATVFLWREARKRRYAFLSPPKAGYLLVPYLNLTPQERVQVVLAELAEGRAESSEVSTIVDGKPAKLLAFKKWGVLLLNDMLLPLERYPLVSLESISFGMPDSPPHAHTTPSNSAPG